MFFIFALALASIIGCTTLLRVSGGYDSRVISVQTLSLFNQRDVGKSKEKSWRGDWIFRRERLALIDQSLRGAKPDIFLMQEVMERKGSPSEADSSILMAGSLTGYSFDKLEVTEYEDTREIESLGTAVGLPLRLMAIRQADKKRSWQLGDDGFMAASLLKLEGQLLAVFNVQMPDASDGNFLWFKFMQDRILEFTEETSVCTKRIIVAGYMPVEMNSSRFQDFMSRLNLKDVAEGVCKITSNCNTRALTNEIFQATRKGQEPARTDRILVSADAPIYSSARTFQESDSASRYAKDFGITQLWPAQRFGWGAAFRLPRCSDDHVTTD